jgi:hypothetical protein
MPRFPGVVREALTARDLAWSGPRHERLVDADPMSDDGSGPFRHVVQALASAPS